MQSLNGDCDNIPASVNSDSILRTSHNYGLMNEYRDWGYWLSGRRFLWASCSTWGQSVNSISGIILFLPQQVLLIPGSRKLILKYVFSIVCTNLSWIMFRKVSLWFKSVLFHCNEEWSSSYPLVQLLMRIHGMTSGKLLSFKQQIKKIQINSNKSVCKECFPLLLCLADLY